jgi:septal ring factor EnvC (AmiA/AmiB activator)
MPTDARQIAEDYARVIEQRDRAMELLDKKNEQIEGWRRRLKETNEQWIKETNENREIIQTLEKHIALLEDELLRVGLEQDAAKAKEREARAADTARRRSEGAKSGWEIRRKKARLTAPERPWRVHGTEPGSRIECRVERWCESHEEALHYAEKFKAEGYVVTVEDRRNA